MIRLTTVAVLFFMTATAGAADDAGKKFLKGLEGSYTPTSITRAGDPAPDEFLKSILSITIKGDSFVLRLKNGDKEENKEATLSVDSTQTPIAIDMTPKSGNDASRRVPGIIKVEKDTVTICWADRSDKAERPKEFASTKDNKHFLIVMKKK